MTKEIEYEKYLDDETAQLMENITYAQIVEALSHYVDKDGKEDDLAHAVRHGDAVGKYMAGAYLVATCHEYWRELLDYKHSNNIKENDSPFGEEYGPRT